MTGKTFWAAALITALTCGHTAAATLDDMRALHATLKKGMTVMCLGEKTYPSVAGIESIKKEIQATGKVVSNSADGTVFDITERHTVNGKEAPIMTATYRQTITLEKERQRYDIDPDSLKLNVPANPSAATWFAELIKASTPYYSDYSQIRITGESEYEELSDEGGQEPILYRCGPVKP